MFAPVGHRRKILRTTRQSFEVAPRHLASHADVVLHPKGNPDDREIGLSRLVLAAASPWLKLVLAEHESNYLDPIIHIYTEVEFVYLRAIREFLLNGRVEARNSSRAENEELKKSFGNLGIKYHEDSPSPPIRTTEILIKTPEINRNHLKQNFVEKRRSESVMREDSETKKQRVEVNKGQQHVQKIPQAQKFQPSKPNHEEQNNDILPKQIETKAEHHQQPEIQWSTLETKDESLFIDFINLSQSLGIQVYSQDIYYIVKDYLRAMKRNVKGFEEDHPKDMNEATEWCSRFVKGNKGRFRLPVNQETHLSRPDRAADMYTDKLRAVTAAVDPDHVFSLVEVTFEDGLDKTARRILRHPEIKSPMSLILSSTSMALNDPMLIVNEKADLDAMNMKIPDAWKPIVGNERGILYFDSFPKFIRKHVFPWAKALPKQAKKIILADINALHPTMKLLSECRQLNLQFLAVPSNQTHFLPLDNLANDLRRELDRICGHPNFKVLPIVKKSNFLLNSTKMKLEAYRHYNIRSFYENVGFVSKKAKAEKPETKYETKKANDKEIRLREKMQNGENQKKSQQDQAVHAPTKLERQPEVKENLPQNHQSQGQDYFVDSVQGMDPLSANIGQTNQQEPANDIAATSNLVMDQIITMNENDLGLDLNVSEHIDNPADFFNKI